MGPQRMPQTVSIPTPRVSESGGNFSHRIPGEQPSSIAILFGQQTVIIGSTDQETCIGYSSKFKTLGWLATVGGQKWKACTNNLVPVLRCIHLNFLLNTPHHLWLLIIRCSSYIDKELFCFQHSRQPHSHWVKQIMADPLAQDHFEKAGVCAQACWGLRGGEQLKETLAGHWQMKSLESHTAPTVKCW